MKHMAVLLSHHQPYRQKDDERSNIQEHAQIELNKTTIQITAFSAIETSVNSITCSNAS